MARPFPKQVIATGLALSLIGGLVLVPAILHTDSGAAAAHWTGGQRRTTSQRFPTARWRTRLAARSSTAPVSTSCCSATATPACTSRRSRTSPQQNGLTLSVAAGPLCPWQQRLYYLIGVQTVSPKHNDWYGGLVDELAARRDRHGRSADRRHGERARPSSSADGRSSPATSGFEEALTDESAASIAKLRAAGRKLVIIEPIPIATKDDDPINCLSSASSVDDCIYQANPQPTPLEDFYRIEAAQRSVWSCRPRQVGLPAAARPAIRSSTASS